MFKADGELLLGRLQEHLRSRGHGTHVSVAVSPKGSYREADDLNFLERHLPPMSTGRRWRIQMLDDLSSHKGDNVRKLCWNRGYCLVIHGGGNTPVAQTPDTDLNQHVRRDYTRLEAEELIRTMRSGVSVPRLSESVRIDMMTDVWSRQSLHLNASAGYLKTGATVALDGSEDHLIVREAARFWNSLGMRDKINREVEQVRAEVRAGRLTWCYEDVQRLIPPYPVRKKIDETLERLGEDAWLDLEEGELPYDDVAGEDGAGPDSGTSDEGGDCDEVSAGAAVAAGPAGGCAVNSSPVDAKTSVRESVALTATEAMAVHSSHDLVSAYEKAIGDLKQVGAMSAVVHLENEIRKEKRRRRTSCQQNPAVAEGLARLCEAEQASNRLRQRQVDALNAQKQTASKLRAEVARATQEFSEAFSSIAVKACLITSQLHCAKDQLSGFLILS